MKYIQFVCTSQIVFCPRRISKNNTVKNHYHLLKDKDINYEHIDVKKTQFTEDFSDF